MPIAGDKAMIAAFLITVRDALIALALSWVGVSLEARQPEAPSAPSREAASAAPACASGLCAASKPSFSAFDCDEG